MYQFRQVRGAVTSSAGSTSDDAKMAASLRARGMAFFSKVKGKSVKLNCENYFIFFKKINKRVDEVC